jgi:hypothetical protein
VARRAWAWAAVLAVALSGFTATLFLRGQSPDLNQLALFCLPLGTSTKFLTSGFWLSPT